MTVDRDRAQVYAAEIAAFDGTDLEQLISVDGAIAAARRVVASAWWPGGEVGFRSMRADARSSLTHQRREAGSMPVVALAAGQASLATVAHELAHVLAGIDCGHDATFRRAHLDVVHVATNLDVSDARRDLHVSQLERAYRSADLPIGVRAWPAPPPFPPGRPSAIAL